MASSYDAKLEMIRKFVALVKEVGGFSVYLSHNKHYGYYTDPEGKRVVSFQTSYGFFQLSGNYVTGSPKISGTGWVIFDELYGSDEEIKEKIQRAWDCSPPSYVLKRIGSDWRYATQQDHIDRYQQSSRYEEV